MMNDPLQRGIALARAGKRAEARALLMQVVEADEQSETGWLWLSGVVDEPEDIRTCLENVLALNPENHQARQGLEWLRARYGITIDEPATPPTPLLIVADPQPLAPAAPVGTNQAHHAAEPDTSVASDAVFASDETFPCPYCGAPTVLKQQHCTQCRQSLMVRGAPAPTNSLWLTLSIWVRWIDAGIAALAGMAILLIATMTYQAWQRSDAADATRQAINQAASIAIVAVILFLLAWMSFSLGQALRQRILWAYQASAGLSLIGSIVWLIQTIAGATALTERVLPNPTAADAALVGSGMLGLSILLLLTNLGLAGLSAASYTDFYPPMVRFRAVVKPTAHEVHYNNGIGYKNRGMWYMAMREWEMAVLRAPYDLNYLHALGLAYAQVRRFDQARTTLDKALSIAPGHRQISESRSLVDQMAAKQ